MSLTITGILTMVLSQILGDQVEPGAIETFLNVGVLLIGAFMAYWGRVRKGDLTWFGTRK